MSAAVPAIPELTEDHLVLTRTFDAPREIIWRFFTEPPLLAVWFGPKEVHVDPASVEIELRVGGAWNLDMIDNATGEHYPFRSTLQAVSPPEYLEAASAPIDEHGPQNELLLRLWFDDHGSKTRLTLHQGPFTPEFREMTGAGWTASFAVIDELLASGVA